MGGMFGAIAISPHSSSEARRKGGKDRGRSRSAVPVACSHGRYEIGSRPRSTPEREHAWPIYDIFETAGGAGELLMRIFIGVATEGHWQSFCREFGLRFRRSSRCTTTERRVPRGSERLGSRNLSASRHDSRDHLLLAINRPEDLLRIPCVAARRPRRWHAFRVPACCRRVERRNIGEGESARARRRNGGRSRLLKNSGRFSTAKPAVRLA